MYVLGLNLIHATSAALIKDGKIIGAVEEERFNRQKHSEKFPTQSIQWLLKSEGITLKDIEHIVTSFDFDLFKDNEHPFEYNTICHDDSNLAGTNKIRADNQMLYLQVKREMEKNGISNWIGINHHLAHAAGTYYLSDFDECNILVIDGRGESTAVSLMHGKDGKIEVLEEYPIKDSLGHLYSYATHICGLYSNIGQEGKTMGLAPYGSPSPDLEMIFNKIVEYADNRYSINREEMRKLEQYKHPTGKIDNVSKSLAYHVQRTYENILLFLARNLYNKTGCTKFALSGGVSLNCEGNRLLLNQSFVDEIYVQPAANDGGTAVGAALYWYAKTTGLRPPKQEDVYFGPEYTNEEIENVLSLYKIAYKKVVHPEKIAAELLSNGNIIGWFQGRMEYGPRALGNRSILADPRTLEMKDKVNKFVKFREMWRPFAPSILSEAISDYFTKVYESPHMNISFLTKTEMQEYIPASIHIDGTARVQTVTKEKNKKYYNLINNFREITGVPVILNTSFNGADPVVCTPADALRAFYSSGLDALVIRDFVVTKSDEIAIEA